MTRVQSYYDPSKPLGYALENPIAVPSVFAEYSYIQSLSPLFIYKETLYAIRKIERVGSCLDSHKQIIDQWRFYLINLSSGKVRSLCLYFNPYSDRFPLSCHPSDFPLPKGFSFDETEAIDESNASPEAE